MSSKEADNNRGLCLLKGRSVALVVGLDLKMFGGDCLFRFLM
jgi:hypothetical protein